MRIAFVTNDRFPARDGIARHLTEITTRLDRRGVECIVLSPGSRFGRWQQDRDGSTAHLRYPYWKLRPFHHAMIRRMLQRWIDEGAGDADIIHAHLPLIPPIDTDKPLFVTFHSPLLSDTAAIPERDVRARLVRLNARLVSAGYEQQHIDRASRIIAVSDGVASELDRHYRCPRASVEVITNGVDSRFFGFSPCDRRSRHLLYAGRIGYRKGLFRLLDALALLKDPRIRLEIAGEGPLEGRLRNHARQLGIAERVNFIGFLDRNQLREKLKRVACLVNPADYETGPLTVLEAMSAGTPVLSTATGLVGEMGPHAPVLLTDMTALSLAQAVERILVHPAEARDRALAARRLIDQRFDWERVTDRLLGLYRCNELRAA